MSWYYILVSLLSSIHYSWFASYRARRGRGIRSYNAENSGGPYFLLARLMPRPCLMVRILKNATSYVALWANLRIDNQALITQVTTFLRLSPSFNHILDSLIFMAQFLVKDWGCYDLCLKHRGKSLLEMWVTTFLPLWQPPFIFVWFISNFLCMCSESMASAHVIVK